MASTETDAGMFWSGVPQVAPASVEISSPSALVPANNVEGRPP